MQPNTSLNTLIGQTDIYLLDQIMKGRYRPGDRVLDAGCGTGRNLPWFVHAGVSIYGVDMDETALHHLKAHYPQLPAEQFSVATLERLPFPDRAFDHVICSAVLHFAQSEVHFLAMTEDLVRVLKPGGSLFIRMATDIGIERQVVPVGNGVCLLPDGSTRFLLTRKRMQEMVERFPLRFLEPFKVVNVADLRCMSTLVLERI